MVRSILQLSTNSPPWPTSCSKAQLFLALLAMATIQTGQADRNDNTAHDANNAVKDFCTARAYTEAIIGQLQNWVTDATSSAKNLAAEAQILAAAAAANLNKAKAKAYILLSAIAEEKAKEAAAIAASTSATAVAQRQGEAAAHYATAKQISKVKAKAHTVAQSRTNALGGSGSNGGTCAVTTAAELHDKETCDQTSTNVQKAKTIAAKLLTATKLKIGGQSKLVLPTATITIEAVDNLDTRGNWKAASDNKACVVSGGGAAAAGSESAGLAVTTVTATAAIVAEEVEIDDKQSEQHASSGTNNQKHVLLQDNDIASALRAARKAYKKPPSKVSDETVENLAATTEAKRLAAYLQNKEGAKIKLETDTAKIAQEIFGMKEGGINEKFLEPLKKEPVNIPTENEPIKGNIQENADGPNFETLMAFYYSHNLNKAAVAAEIKPDGTNQAAASADKAGDKKDGDNKTTAADCKATEADKCDKTNCDWNAEKKQCKVKDGALIISAVIKAPLLLAALLFKSLLLL
uniref:Variant surface glycoprotein 381 n=1 Tax=Trypanosoma brucei TaxID=5691 RepID=M4T1M2_9TRYP|nr:variant surface glycoprotein 381 [Trypanosoma brucei]